MALIPPFFLDTVVALGTPDKAGRTEWGASGFLYGDLMEEVQEGGRLYGIYLVSNRHVLEGQDIVLTRFNPRESHPAREFTLDLREARKQNAYHSHPDPDIDLALVQISGEQLQEQGIQFSFFRSDEHVATKRALDESGASEGDMAYVLGFPMELVGGERSYVIVRSGSIARIRDYLAGSSKEILLDCLLFPGNSGGPVVSKPEVVAISGTKSVSSSNLIGVVSQSISYEDVAYSMQTKRARVVFEDNSGLATIVPAQYVVDLAAGARAASADSSPASPGT